MKKSKSLWLVFTTLALFFCMSCGKDNSVALTDLPAAIKTYVDTNYPGYVLDEAETENDCSGNQVYDVEIEQGEDQEQELTFDADGKFLYSESEIPQNELPDAVKNSINSNYAGYGIKESNKLSLANGSVQFEVELKKGKSQKEVIFDSEGVVICEQEGD